VFICDRRSEERRKIKENGFSDIPRRRIMKVSEESNENLKKLRAPLLSETQKKRKGLSLI